MVLGTRKCPVPRCCSRNLERYPLPAREVHNRRRLFWLVVVGMAAAYGVGKIQVAGCMLMGKGATQHCNARKSRRDLLFGLF